MRYSQPYGTPEPPIGTYPRYINGNPVTGTGGSIPPNTAVDEDQIEIVTVIQNAGLTPDHSDLTQLWQAIQLLIAKKYITTDITKTVHGAGADFVDLQSAFTWLSEYTITNTGSVTFMVAAGKWTYTATCELNHANSNRIIIQGAALKGAAPQPSTFQYSGPHNASDGTYDIIALRNIYSTELSFTGGVTGFWSRRDGVTLRYLLITGSQTIASGGNSPSEQNRQGNGLMVNATLYVDSVSIWGFGRHGVYVEQSGLFVLGNNAFSLVYNGVYGIYIINGLLLGSFSPTGYLMCVSNGSFGINADGANITGWCFIVRANGSGGANFDQGTQASGQRGCQFMQNGGVGCQVSACAAFVGQYSTYAYNSGWGVYAVGSVIAWIDYSSVIGNGVGSVVAATGGTVEMTGSGYDGAVSPPINSGVTAGGAAITG